VPAPPPALTFSVADLDRAEVGVNTTLIVQDAPTARDVPQVLVCENWLGLLPESVMPVMVTAAVPLFVTVTDWGALEVFVAWLPNDKDVGDTANGGTPTPLSATV